MKWTIQHLVTCMAALVILAGHAHAGVILADNFDSGIDPGTFASTQNALAVGDGLDGFLSGNAIHFGTLNALERLATTNPLDVSTGGTISFDFRGGNEDVDGPEYWENTEGANEWAHLFYSIDGGSNFVELADLNTQLNAGQDPTKWLHFDIAIPLEAQTTGTQFRFQQSTPSGMGYDLWAIDNLVVTNGVTAVPEPASLALMGIGFGLAGAGVFRRRNKN